MYVTQKLFWAIFLLSIAGCLSLRQCNDCIPLPQCDIASNLLKNDKSKASILKIKNSICNIRKHNKITQGVSVCCSDFIFSRIYIDDDDIENHKNRILLPNSRNCGHRLGNKVIGGSRAALNEFPWMAILVNKDKYPVCGASLINEHYILTAAHCVYRLPQSTRVRLGEYDIHKSVDCDLMNNNYCIQHVDLEISEVKVHPEYKYFPYMVNDIALIRLASPANVSYHNIKPICLPIPLKLRNRKLDDEIATIAGWGQTENGATSGVLIKAEVPILNKTTCTDYYPSSANASQMCAGIGGKDTCKGDSGGPLMVEDIYYENYKVVQYGIVSYGYITCNGVNPGVYVDVRPYLRWILDNIEA